MESPLEKWVFLKDIRKYQDDLTGVSIKSLEKARPRTGVHDCQESGLDLEGFQNLQDYMSPELVANLMGNGRNGSGPQNEDVVGFVETSKQPGRWEEKRRGSYWRKGVEGRSRLSPGG